MAKRNTTRTTLAATAVMIVCAVVLPWSCELDTSPRIHRHPPAKRAPADDNDSGETK